MNENANPNSIEDDWIVNFFDKSRIVSDDEMQNLWSRILAGEANAPGTYSKRTVNFLSDLDKSEADRFTKLCGFVWSIGELTLLVFDAEAEIYNRNGIDFATLSHLDSIGLIQFNTVTGLSLKNISKRLAVAYYGRRLTLEIPQNAGNKLPIGKTLLTRLGKELAVISGSKPVEGFLGVCEGQMEGVLAEVTDAIESLGRASSRRRIATLSGSII